MQPYIVGACPAVEGTPLNRCQSQNPVYIGDTDFYLFPFVCLNRSDICNGRYQCWSGEDERPEFCPCDMNEFRCHEPFWSESRCISLSYACDGNASCSDGSDEDEEMCHVTCPADTVR